MNMIRTLIFTASILSVPLAQAQVEMSGSFRATQDCPAVQSIKKKTNPDGAEVKNGETYVLRGKNKDQATHYFVEVPTASPARRWVSVACGTVDGEAAAATPAANPPSTDKPDFILAVSWQPAFCEGLPNKTECKNQTPDRFDATHFAIHGLWPQPRSNVNCNITAAEKQAVDNRKFDQLPPLQLSPELHQELATVMPGSQSSLDRYEWTKHGTCYQPRDPEIYYRDTLRLVRELNASAAQAFMAANIGKTVTTLELKAKFDETLGAGAGDRMKFSCKKDGDRLLLVEITIGLRGNITSGLPLAELIAASAPTAPDCPRFVVDPVGLQ